MLKSRTPNKAEKNWLDLSHQIPCLACSLFHGVHDTPAEYHHIKGKTALNAHLTGFSLCANHHRHKDAQKRWTSRHGDGLKAFERAYMPEINFLSEQIERVNELKRCIV